MTPEELNRDIELAEDFISKISASDVPETLIEAIKKGRISAKYLELGFAEYDDDQRRRDRSRLIPVRTVLSVLQDYEEALVTALIVAPGFIAFRTLTAPFQAALAIFTNFQTIWKLLRSLDDLDSLINFILFVLFKTTAISAIAAVAKTAASESIIWKHRMRTKACPQRTGKRYYRLRRSRT